MNDSEIRKARHEYYLKNKERINAVARERYEQKKKDPNFYKQMLLKNQDSYHARVNRKKAPLTAEEEEAYMKKIIRDVESLQDQDKDKPKKALNFKTITELFYD